LPSVAAMTRRDSGCAAALLLDACPVAGTTENPFTQYGCAIVRNNPATKAEKARIVMVVAAVAFCFLWRIPFGRIVSFLSV
jgi:hypothetical protein